VKNKAPNTNQTTTIGIEVPISKPIAAIGSQKINIAITSTIGTKKSLIRSPKFLDSSAKAELVINIDDNKNIKRFI
jgi:hypothetical protein